MGALVWAVVGTAAAQVDEESDALSLDALFVDVGLAVNTGGSSPGFKAELGPSIAFVAPPIPEVDVDLSFPFGFGYADLSQDIAPMPFVAQTLWVEGAAVVDGVFAVHRDVHLVAGAGVGLSWSHTTVDQAFIGPQASWSFAFLVRFRGGIRFRPTDHLWLQAQPLAASIYVASATSALFSFLVGLTYEI